jgi:circadian clock protein KaiC
MGGDGSAETRKQAPRISSGTPHLDAILAGGWLQGGVYILAGPPGAGKTTLGNQFCFSMAERGENTLYITLLAETHSRMMLHLGSMAFFRPEWVGSRVYYLSGTTPLNEEGPKGLMEMISRTVRERRIKALVLDGLSLVRERAESPNAMREFLHSLSVLCGLMDCTALLLSTEVNKATDVEYAMADGIIALSAELIGLKATRGLEVIKFRGSNNLPGRHTFLISEQGFLVYPRWEALHRKVSERVPDPDVRLHFGIPSLDAMCGGGLVFLSTTIVLGSPGSGKTLLGLHFLAEGTRRGEKGLYFGFAETGNELIRKCQSVGLDLAPLAQEGLLRLESRAPVETLPDAMAQELLQLVEQHGYQRVFLDGLEPFAKEAIDPERTTRFLTSLLNALRDRGVTTLITAQTNTLFGPELHSPIKGSEAICDNILFVRFAEMHGQLKRMLLVMKMRDSVNDPFLREFVITSHGVEVGDSFASIEGMLTGQPRHWDRPTPSEGPGAEAPPQPKRKRKGPVRRLSRKKAGSRK